MEIIHDQRGGKRLLARDEWDKERYLFIFGAFWSNSLLIGLIAKTYDTHAIRGNRWPNDGKITDKSIEIPRHYCLVNCLSQLIVDIQTQNIETIWQTVHNSDPNYGWSMVGVRLGTTCGRPYRNLFMCISRLRRNIPKAITNYLVKRNQILLLCRKV